jgi:hypothetical protein
MDQMERDVYLSVLESVKTVDAAMTVRILLKMVRRGLETGRAMAQGHKWYMIVDMLKRVT